MLFLLTQLMVQNTEACEPIDYNAELLSTFPINGSLEVSMDAVLFLEFGNGIIPEDMSAFTLRQDDIELEVEAQIVMQNTALIGEPSIIEIRPIGELRPNQQFVLEQNNEPIMTFITAEQSSNEVEGIPQIGWADQYFIDKTQYEEISNCEPSTQTNVYISFEEQDLKQEQAVVLYQVDENGVGISDEPFFMLLDSEEYSVSVDQMYTTVEDEFCFVAAFVSEAGEEGELSDVFCATDFYDEQWECGFAGPLLGCSTMSPDSFAWMSLGLGLVGLVRRRRK